MESETLERAAVWALYKGKARHCEISLGVAGYDQVQKAQDVLYNVSSRPRGELELVLPLEFGSSEELKKYGTPKTVAGKSEALVVC
eukprot:m51a1_g11536 hypothetical protein (86) ;mRNA; f:8747-9542